MNETKNINIQLIDRPVPPVRLEFNEEEIEALKASIGSQGILVPLLVRAVGERFEVIDGDCRLEAAVRLRLREVPCVVRNATDSETHVLRMLANLDRSNPDPVSEAVYIARVVASGVLTVEDFAAKLGRSVNWVEDRLAIAEMPDYMQYALKNKSVALGVALALYEIDDDDTRRRWFDSAARDGMSVSQAEYCVRQYRDLVAAQANASGDILPPPIPEQPPQIIAPCARCGEMSPVAELRFVRVHIRECGTERG